jgi:protein-S-isoprenylcysteine O-methyltransferase Ste14
MEGYVGAVALLLLFVTVAVRVLVLGRAGVRAVKFGKTDRTDFLIPPFFLVYLYIIVTAALHGQRADRLGLVWSGLVSWVGALLCVAGWLLLVLALISFGRSFRVGIDPDDPDRLVTTGVFAFTRNPIYVALGSVLLGECLVFTNWILWVYLIAASWLFHRQISREEEYLREHYGQQYAAYCERVPRYL